MRLLNSLLLFLFLSSCQNKIETYHTLDKSDLQRLKTLNLLNKDEKIVQFYSEYKNSVSGSFFTNEKVANYWQDERNKLKNRIDFAYYKDIIKIEPFLKVVITYCPYILITKSNHKKFKVYVDGSEKEKKYFLISMENLWKKNVESNKK